MSPAGSVVMSYAFAAGGADIPRVSVGASLGGAVSLSGLGVGYAAGGEASVYPERSGRVEILFGGGIASGAARGTGSDAAFEEPFQWTLDMSSLYLDAGVRVRLLPLREPISPVVGIGPLSTFGTATAGGSANGVPLPTTTEAWWGVGGWARAGLAARVGPGSLEGAVDLQVSTCQSQLAGAPLLTSLIPAVRYRIER